MTGAIILVTALCLLYPPFRSYLVMIPYSGLHHRNSVLYEEGIVFRIPGGRGTGGADWYPFVITFTDDKGFSWFIDEPAAFTVLYNFGHFKNRNGRSVYYDPESPYYSSFYGGYVVRMESGRHFGFYQDGGINPEELVKVPYFDQIHLVLSSLGCPVEKRTFQEDNLMITHDVSYLGIPGWVRIDSQITTNSPLHTYKEFQMGYLQFGSPPRNGALKEDFPLVDLKGRAYVRYFDEYNATFVLYAMASDWAVVEACDRDFLARVVIGDYSSKGEKSQ